MIKKIYEKPLVMVVEMNPVTLICTSPLTSVNVNASEEMGEYDEFE